MHYVITDGCGTFIGTDGKPCGRELARIFYTAVDADASLLSIKALGLNSFTVNKVHLLIADGEPESDLTNFTGDSIKEFADTCNAAATRIARSGHDEKGKRVNFIFQGDAWPDLELVGWSYGSYNCGCEMVMDIYIRVADEN